MIVKLFLFEKLLSGWRGNPKAKLIEIIILKTAFLISEAGTNLFEIKVLFRTAKYDSSFIWLHKQHEEKFLQFLLYDDEYLNVLPMEKSWK